MLSWINNASKALSTIIDDTIKEEDEQLCVSPNRRREILTPLQEHLGFLKTKPKPLFHVLPTELKIYIFSFLPADDLTLSVCLVCREWKKLANDDLCWKWRFLREMTSWSVIGFHPQFQSKNSVLPYFESEPLLPPPIKSETPIKSFRILACKQEEPEQDPNEADSLRMTWKLWYLQQYLHNNTSHNSPERALRKIMTASESRSFQPFNFFRTASLSAARRFHSSRARPTRNLNIFRIPIFGQAMESSAAGLLYKLMWSQESPLFVTGLYPGIDGIGSGVGFKVNSKSLNLAAIYGDFLGGMEEWKECFQAADGMIYVIDSMLSEVKLARAKQELHLMMNINEDIPLLVFACDTQLNSNVPESLKAVQDEDEDESELERYSPCQLMDCLTIATTSRRRWCIRSAASLSDICKGLEWLSQEM